MKKRKKPNGDEPFISKHEVAQAYAPNLSPTAALNRLALWISSNRKLKSALERSKYLPLQRKFSRNQYNLIIKYLGEP